MFQSYSTKDKIELMLIDTVNSSAEKYMKALKRLEIYRKNKESRNENENV